MFCLVTLLSFLMPPFILTFWTAHTIYYLKGKNLVLNLHLKTWTLLYLGASQALCVGRVCPPPGLLWCVQRGKRSFSLHPLFTPFLALCAQPYLTNSLEFFTSLCLSLLSPRGSPPVSVLHFGISCLIILTPPSFHTQRTNSCCGFMVEWSFLTTCSEFSPPAISHWRRILHAQL